MILVSSCLAGLEVRYNGSHRLDSRIAALVERNQAMRVCPELLGGFSTPREPAEIVGGDGEDVLSGRAKVINRKGQDVTEMYIRGAKETLGIAQRAGAHTVVLKEYSPSCGSMMIYNGRFSGEKITGVGVTTALLQRHGIRVVSEEGLAELLNEMEG